MIYPVNSLSTCKKGLDSSFGSKSLTLNEGILNFKTLNFLDTLKSAYREIYNKIGLMSESDLEKISKRLNNIRLLEADNGIMFYDVANKNLNIHISMPDFSKRGNAINIAINKGETPVESFFINNSKVAKHINSQILSQKELETNHVAEKIEKHTNLIDLPLFNLRKFISSDEEITKISNELEEKKRALERAFALLPKRTVVSVKEPERIVHRSKPVQDPQTINIRVKKEEMPKPFNKSKPQKLSKPHKPTKLNKQLSLKKSKIVKEKVYKPIAKKEYDYSQSLVTPQIAFDQAKTVHEKLINVDKLVKQYSAPVMVDIRNAFANYEYTYGNTVIKLKDIGDERLKLAFRLGKTQKKNDFYYLAVMDAQDQLKKAYVVSENKIVDASKFTYPIKSFIPEEPVIVSKEEQADFIKYLKIMDEKLSTFNKFVQNKGWHKS